MDSTSLPSRVMFAVHGAAPWRLYLALFVLKFSRTLA